MTIDPADRQRLGDSHGSRIDAIAAAVDAAGRRARDEARMLDQMMERMRLDLFRTYLCETVSTMSGLVPEVLAMVGWDVPRALQCLRPSGLWPAVTAKADEYGRTGPKANRRVKVGNGVTIRPAMFIGDAVIAENPFGSWVEVKVNGGSFDVVLRDEGFTLSTQDGMGYLRFPRELPDTIVAACMGRDLETVVDHPVLRDRNYVITKAAQVGGTSSMTFDVGRLPLAMPWRP